MRNKDESLKHSYKIKKKLFITIDIWKSTMLGSLRHLIDKE